MAFLKSVIAFISKLPIAAYIKPLWKKALKYMVQEQGDALQKRLHEVIDAKKEGAAERLDAELEVFEGKIGRILKGMSVPLLVRMGVEAFIHLEGKKMRDAMKQAIKEKSNDAFDKAFDAAQVAVLAKIDTL